MEKLTKGEEIEQRIAPEIVELVDQFKKHVMGLVELVETIKTRCYDYGIGDADVWILLNHALAKLDINSQQKKRILAPFRPPKPMTWTPTAMPQKRLSSLESFEGNFEIYFPLNILDDNEVMAKKSLIAMIQQAEHGFFIKLENYKATNIKPDMTDQWIVPESTADETFIS